MTEVERRTVARARTEARIVGRRIRRVIWSNRPCLGAIDDNQVAGFELDTGEIISLSASGQIDVDVVWLEVEP